MTCAFQATGFVPRRDESAKRAHSLGRFARNVSCKVGWNLQRPLSV